MNADDVQTLAPEPDLFQNDEPLPSASEHARGESFVLEIHGVLLHPATVSNKIVGNDHHLVPVLCMELRPASGRKHTVVAYEVFTEATRHLAEAKAKSLKRGTHVTFTTTTTGMRTLFPHVRHVDIFPHP